MNVQVGTGSRALFVLQTPPPAAAAQTRHGKNPSGEFPSFVFCFGLVVPPQVGSTASAVIRPDAVYGAPLKVRTAGKFAVSGPASDHDPIRSGELVREALSL